MLEAVYLALHAAKIFNSREKCGIFEKDFKVIPRGGGELPIFSDGGSDTASVWKTQKYTEFCRFLRPKIYLSLQGK